MEYEVKASEVEGTVILAIDGEAWALSIDAARALSESIALAVSEASAKARATARASRRAGVCAEAK